MKAILHIHPHFAHFIQSLVLAEKLFDVDEVSVIDAPSFHHDCTSRFSEYLATGLQEISQATNKKIEITDLVWPSLFQWHNILRSKLPNSVFYACRDSLLRGKFSHLYVLLPKVLRRLLEFALYTKAKFLYSAYRASIRSTGACLSIASHSTYMPYVTLIEASLDEGIPILVLYGCVDRAIYISGKRLIYHYACMADRITANINPQILHPHRLKSTYAHRTSLYHSTLRNSNLAPSVHRNISTKHPDPTPPHLLVLLHCIKDNNHTQNPFHMLFENYFQWALYTCLFLALNKSNYKKILIKVHPHAQSFGDYTLLLWVARLASIGLNKNKVTILNSKSSLAEQQIVGSNQLVPLTFHGSVAYENASIGLKTLTVGDTPCPSDAYYRVTSKSEYFSILKDYRSLPDDFLTTLDEHLQEKASHFISAIECMKPYPSSVTNLILSLRKYFFFNKQNPIDGPSLHHSYNMLLRQKPQLISIDTGHSSILYRR